MSKDTSDHQDVGGARHYVENLLYEYTALADQLDAEGIGQLLSEATLKSTAGVEVHGTEAISSHLAGLFVTAQKSRHMMSNVRVTVAPDGDAATSICLYNKWVIDGAPRLDAVGRYHSSFRRDDGTWRFESHLVENQWRF